MTDQSYLRRRLSYEVAHLRWLLREPRKPGMTAIELGGVPYESSAYEAMRARWLAEKPYPAAWGLRESEVLFFKGE